MERHFSTSAENFAQSEGRVCECGFKFAGPGEFRNCEAYLDDDNQWWVICPKCGQIYKSD